MPLNPRGVQTSVFYIDPGKILEEMLYEHLKNGGGKNSLRALCPVSLAPAFPVGAGLLVASCAFWHCSLAPPHI